MKYNFNTSDNELSSEFFIPCLKVATQYDRGVGFFSSGWLRANAKGLSHFTTNWGRARWITSPILHKDDWNAILEGNEDQNRAILKANISRNIDEIESSLEKNTLNILSWLIADDILEFRIAIPKNKLDGDYHDKFGIFTDFDGNKVSFKGSMNESIRGTRNYESISVFKSWMKGQSPYLNEHIESFERLWNNQDLNLSVLEIDEVNKKKLIRLRTSDRPYKKSTNHRNYPHYQKSSNSINEPRIPYDIELRDYQREAISAWFKNKAHGILKMATGTGKTITALSGATKLWQHYKSEVKKPLTILVVCPYRHLVTQWYDNSKSFNYSPLKCYESYQNWGNSMNSSITSVNANVKNNLFIVTTNSTFSSNRFQNILSNLLKPLLIIADEVHNLGSPHLRSKLPAIAEYRLGLSATPERWHDDEGTQSIIKYFGNPVFEYGLKEAIENGHLCQYNYHPILVPLTEQELHEYLEISREISKFVASGIFSIEDEGTPLHKKLIARARITATAENKLQYLKDVFLENNLVDSKHNLIYCGDGRVEAGTGAEEMKQIEAITRIIGKELRMLCSKYVAETTTEQREVLLNNFAKGKLQSLVAIRCLDEGVDVPATKRAFILASSTNPRQFIQRRGRVLRKSPNKEIADIWDFIVIPPANNVNDATFSYERKLIEKELTRVIEFTNLAENAPQANDKLLSIKEQYNLLHL